MQPQDMPDAEGPRRMLVSVDDAARRLSISRSLLYELLAAGRLPSVRIGRLRRIPVEALDAFVQEMMSQGPGDARG